MTIGTAVFRRIVKEKVQEGRDELRYASVNAICEALQQTYRFMSFDESYRRQCAEDLLNSHIDKCPR